MDMRDLIEAARAFVGQLQQGAAAIPHVPDAANKPGVLQTIGEFGGGVGLDDKNFGQIADAEAGSSRSSANGEQSLIPARTKASVAQHIVAERRKPPQGVPEMGQSRILGLRKGPRLWMIFDI